MKSQIVTFLITLTIMALGDQPKSQFKLVRIDDTEDSHLVIEKYEDETKEISQLWTADETRSGGHSLDVSYCIINVQTLTVTSDLKLVNVNPYHKFNKERVGQPENTPYSVPAVTGTKR